MRSLSIVLVLLGTAFSFSPTPYINKATGSSDTALQGWLDNAFKNDDSLGKPQSAGLTNGPKFNEQVTVNGKQVPGAVAGQKLTAVANKVRVKIPVNCQQGDCGTCMVKLNGRKVKGTIHPGRAILFSRRG